MTSSSFTSSNSNLNREDSFSNISDIIMGERAETFSATSQMTNQDIILLNKRIDELSLKLLNAENKSEELNKNNEYLALELKKLKEEKACYFKIFNKWRWIYDVWPCCLNNCVNTDRPTNKCEKGFGYVQITSNTNIKYNCNNSNRDNKEARIQGGHGLDKPEPSKLCLNCSTYTLCYYEIKLQIEKGRPLIVDIGLTHGYYIDYVYLCLTGGYIYHFDNILNKTKFINLSSSFSFNNEDIIGCGVVYPPPNINNKLPYIFFTKNGELIGKAIEVKVNYEYLFPFVALKCCSIEANFGEDLLSNPFKYDVSNHYVVKEFYEEKEFSDE